MEYFDICDEAGMPTGEIVERSVAHRDGIRHRTAHIWVVRQNNGRIEVLLQKRSMNKDSFPGCYDTSSAGHIQAGDEPLESAIRELSEELGINARPSDLSVLGHFSAVYQKEFHGGIFKDNEYVNVYVYNGDVDIDTLTIQKEELEEVRWFELKEVISECANHNKRFCVPRESLDILKAKYL